MCWCLSLSLELLVQFFEKLFLGGIFRQEAPTSTFKKQKNKTGLLLKLQKSTLS